MRIAAGNIWCRTIKSSVFAAALAIGLLAGTPLSHAAASPRLHAVTSQPLEVMDLSIGKGEVLILPRAAAAVFVADPEIADIQSPSPKRVFLIAKASGTTTLFALDANDEVILQREIRVRHNVGEMGDMLHSRFPQYSIVLEPARGSIIVSGSVDSASDAEAIIHSIEQAIGEKDKAINRLTISAPTQVNLRVRVIELSRTVDQQFGINWQAFAFPGKFAVNLMNGREYRDPLNPSQYFLPTSGWGTGVGYTSNRVNLNAMIDALDQEGLLTMLAEPNLTAVSGQTASFLAGGEFPVPIASTNNTQTVEFKPFGISLDFTPTVLSRDRISLHVRPEVSELSPANSIVANGLSIPGLTVRRMETTIEIASGQSFAIAGLMQNNIHDQAARLPGLGDLPVLGKLFTSTTYQNAESELVVLVTPYVVKPGNGDHMRSPIDALRPANDVEYLVKKKRVTDDAPDQSVITSQGPRLHGPAGFLY
ncbi:MAG TPA: type II and III secretion system protein family protein [Patescibacteria group bacterium]|nr:type II and III secretion system protein family protein [Patescibacteria group bacterium]